MWDHTVLPATRHKWKRPALTPASKLMLDLPTWRDGRLSWPRLPGNAPAGSRTRDLSITSPTPHHYTTEATVDLNSFARCHCFCTYSVQYIDGRTVKKSRWKLYELVAFGGGNILHWQKVVYLRKICQYRSKESWKRAVDFGRNRHPFYGAISTPCVIGFKSLRDCDVWITIAMLRSDHK